MISRNQIKYINSLKLGKFRHISRTFIAEGPKLLEEILDSKLEIESVFALGQYLEENKDILNDLDCYEVSETELDKISTLKTPNKVLAVVNIPETNIDLNDLGTNLALALNDIRDPGNMGTIIRTADWFGIRQIFCSKECVDIYNPKVVQSTMGSIARVKVHYLNLEDFLKQHSGNIPTFAATMSGHNIYDEMLPDKGIIFIGNESHGIPPELIRNIERQVSIPAGESTTESLNASIATAIILSEFRRQKPLLKQN